MSHVKIHVTRERHVVHVQTYRVKAKRMVSVVGWCVALLVLLSVLILFILLVLLLVIALQMMVIIILVIFSRVYVF